MSRDAADAHLYAETIRTLWPWRWRAYPGWRALARDAFQLHNVASVLYTGSRPFTYRTATLIAAYLESRAATLLALAQAWREYAATVPPKPRHRALAKARAEGRHGWRAAPR